MTTDKLQLCLAGERILEGDARSIRVVFNCLSGRNHGPALSEAHRLYLKAMTLQLGVPSWQGLLSVQDGKGAILASHLFPLGLVAAA